MRSATATSADCSPSPTPGPAARAARLPPRVALATSSGTPRGSSACRVAPATAHWRGGSPAAIASGAEQLGRALLAAFGRDRFRVELQRPLWRGDRARNRRLGRARGAARGPLRGDRERPRPRSRPDPAPGRPGRRPARRDAGVDRAGTARQRLGDADRPGAGGGALPRAPRRGRRDRAARRAAPLRPTTRPRLQLPRRRGRSADRRLAEACRARFGERYDGRPRAGRGRAAARAGAEPDLGPEALRLLPAPPRPPRARPRGRGRGPRRRQRPIAAAAGPRPRLERQLGRLLPDRPLPRRSRSRPACSSGAS